MDPHAPDQPGAGYVLTCGDLESGGAGAAAPLLGVTGMEGSVGVVMLTDSVRNASAPAL